MKPEETPDPNVGLLAKRKKRNLTKSNQTFLPLDAGHHGRQRQGEERPARGSGRRNLKKSKSPQGQVYPKERSHGDAPRKTWVGWVLRFKGHYLKFVVGFYRYMLFFF